MIETPRLILRPTGPRDHDALHAMWSDPAVMRDLGPLKTRADSEATIARHEGYRASEGLGFWTAERQADGAVIGFCGLKPGAADTPIAGDVEIGWLVAQPFWGQGYAREAAEASLAWGWENRPVARIAAIASASNLPSQALMRRLGMLWFADFEHPLFAEGERLRASVAYAVERPR